MTLNIVMWQSPQQDLKHETCSMLVVEKNAGESVRWPENYKYVLLLKN